MSIFKFNFYYFIVALAFGLSFSSCGKKTRTAPVQKTAKKAEPEGALDGRGQATIPEDDYSSCVRNNCPTEANVQLVLEGQTALKGFIGENNKPVQWKISVKNNQNRKMGVAIDPEANLYKMNTGYIDNSDKASMKVNWSASRDSEGLLQIVIRDISRCEAISEESLVSSCSDMNSAATSIYNVQAKIPFKVAENMFSNEAKDSGSVWGQVLGCLASGVAGSVLESEALGAVAGGVIDGIFGGGKKADCNAGNVTGVGEETEVTKTTVK